MEMPKICGENSVDKFRAAPFKATGYLQQNNFLYKDCFVTRNKLLN
jgi:hypothetical protein